MLDDAVYTSPAHPQWNGSAVVGMQGQMAGVGSLLVQESGQDGIKHMDMVVPVDLLEPILDDLRRDGPRRPAAASVARVLRA
ncbi:MAG TPA: hypothetical protein PKB14_23270 [Rubrivivax sp.]|nr:hypothetical protein [Rubrivivax sp.]